MATNGFHIPHPMDDVMTALAEHLALTCDRDQLLRDVLAGDRT